jgi:hypothetical protein
MKEKIFISYSLLLLISACSGNTLAPKNSDEILVNSEPSGASVYVMGKLAGTTPVAIDSANVFPVVYQPDDAQDFGYITLTHRDCSDKKIKISTRMISDGLKVSLDCLTKEEAPIADISLQAKKHVVERTVNQRLKELQALKDEGLISELEYQQIRSRILKSL